MNRCFETAIVALATIVGSVAQAALCPKWDASAEIGRLEPKKIDEASGLAVSRRFDNLYFNNDSGTGPEFWVTSRDGSNARAVKIKNYVPKDPEEIALGPCPVAEKSTEKKTCVILADLGDNTKRRKNFALFFIEELEKFPGEVAPLAIARFHYPDGAHDAEAMAVMPNGDFVVVTKEGSLLKPTRPALVFRARAADVARAVKGEDVELVKFGIIDVPSLVKDKGGGGLVTAMSVASDGSRFVLLTYTEAIEILTDLSAEKWTDVTKESSRVVGIARLQGQECVSYDRNEKDILYSTEQVPQIFGKDQPVPLMKASCKE